MKINNPTKVTIKLNSLSFDRKSIVTEKSNGNDNGVTF